jgi:predicted dehydrogenase
VKVRVGVVGVGFWGRLHAQKVHLLPDAELVGVVDLKYERAKEVAREFHTHPYSAYQELMDKVDAVSVAVPTTGHFPISRDFIKKGIHVFVEKPIASTLAEADALIRLARNHRVVLQVGHLERFNPAFKALKARVRNPLFIETHRLSPIKGRGMEVDVVLDLMIHDLDIILNLVKSKVKTIHAVGTPVISKRIDIANVRIGFAGGCVANITASRISLGEMRKLRLFQPRLYLSADYAAKQVLVARIRKAKKGESFPSIETELLDIPPQDALLEELGAFVTCVKKKTPPPVTGKDGREALALALAINGEIEANLAGTPWSKINA